MKLAWSLKYGFWYSIYSAVVKYNKVLVMAKTISQVRTLKKIVDLLLEKVFTIGDDMFEIKLGASRKLAYIILTPLNSTFI